MELKIWLENWLKENHDKHRCDECGIWYKDRPEGISILDDRLLPVIGNNLYSYICWQCILAKATSAGYKVSIQELEDVLNEVNCFDREPFTPFGSFYKEHTEIPPEEIKRMQKLLKE